MQIIMKILTQICLQCMTIHQYIPVTCYCSCCLLTICSILDNSYVRFLHVILHVVCPQYIVLTQHQCLLNAASTTGKRSRVSPPTVAFPPAEGPRLRSLPPAIIWPNNRTITPDMGNLNNEPSKKMQRPKTVRCWVFVWFHEIIYIYYCSFIIYPM